MKKKVFKIILLSLADYRKILNNSPKPFKNWFGGKLLKDVWK